MRPSSGAPAVWAAAKKAVKVPMISTWLLFPAVSSASLSEAGMHSAMPSAKTAVPAGSPAGAGSIPMTAAPAAVLANYSPVVSGVAFLPMIAMVVVAANLSNILLLPRLGPKPLVTTGMLLAAGSLVWLTRIGVHSGYASAVLGPLLVAGLGIGFTIAPSMNTGTFGVAPADAGVASATLNTGQQVGGSIGTSLLSTIFASAVAGYLTSHLNPATVVHGRPAPSLTGMSLIHGYTTGFWVAAAIFGAGAVVCGTLFRFGPLRALAPASTIPASGAVQQPSETPVMHI
jgi:hypothetical protein